MENNFGFPTWHLFLNSLSSPIEKECNQVRRAYAQSFALFRPNSDDTTALLPVCYSLNFFVKDPEFSYELPEGIKITFHLSDLYPKNPPSISVECANLKEIHVRCISTALRDTGWKFSGMPMINRLLKWLDRNLECILTASNSVSMLTDKKQPSRAEYISTCDVCSQVIGAAGVCSQENILCNQPASQQVLYEKEKVKAVYPTDGLDKECLTSTAPAFLLVSSHIQAMQELGVEEEVSSLALRLTNNLEEAINLVFTVDKASLQEMVLMGQGQGICKPAEKAKEQQKPSEPNLLNINSFCQADKIAFARFSQAKKNGSSLKQAVELPIQLEDKRAFASLNKAKLLERNFTSDMTPQFSKSHQLDQERKDIRILQDQQSAIPEKTAQTCRFFSQNRCSKGEKCPYSHTTNKKKPSNPQPEKPIKMCRYFLQGDCRAGDKCRFRHTKMISEETNPSTLEDLPKHILPDNSVHSSEETIQKDDTADVQKMSAEVQCQAERVLIKISADWSEIQQALLDTALAKFPGSMPAKDRWHAIASLVEGKSVKECIARYKEIKSGLMQQKLPKDTPAEESESSSVEDEPCSTVLVQFPKENRLKIELNPVVKGTEISFEAPTLLNIGTVQVGVLKMQMCCFRCPMSYDISLSIIEPNHKHQQWCKRCSALNSILLRPALLHMNSNVFVYLDLGQCLVKDVLQSTLIITCEECSEEAHIENFTISKRHYQRCCFKCNKSMLLQYKSVIIKQIDGLMADSQEAFTSRKKKQVEQGYSIKPGTPLPENGTCVHFKKSLRWLRFPCCGKAFPCDICHEESDCPQSSDGVFATRMICGLCSKEQIFSNKMCECGAVLGRAPSTRHWEGGKGCRDTVRMSTKDKQKYAGKGKTVCKKDIRTGKLAKEIREHSVQSK